MVSDLVHPFAPVQLKVTPILLPSSVLGVAAEQLLCVVKLIHFGDKRQGESEQRSSVAKIPVAGEHPGDDGDQDGQGAVAGAHDAHNLPVAGVFKSLVVNKTLVCNELHTANKLQAHVWRWS